MALHDGVLQLPHVKALTERLVNEALADIDTPPLQGELALTQDHR
jgi:hypothetical protein